MKLYHILGVEKTASEKELRKAYHALSKKWHPDLFQNDKDNMVEAEKKMKEINNAWEILGSPEKRKRYDRNFDAGIAGQVFEQVHVPEIKVKVRTLKSKTRKCPVCRGTKKRTKKKKAGFLVTEACPRCKGRGHVEKRNRKMEANYYRKDHNKGTTSKGIEVHKTPEGPMGFVSSNQEEQSVN